MTGLRPIAVSVSILFLLAGCSDGGDSGGGPEHDAAERTVTIDGFSYNPATITVQQGDTVIFHNTHNVAHTATLDSGERDTGSIAPGGEAQMTLPTAGALRYHCKIHSSMSGTIVVQEP